MQSILDILVKDETSKTAAAEGLTRVLAASYPEEFKSIAEANGFNITKRLGGHEAIAIAVDAGITMSQLMKVFKHLIYHYSDNLSLPLKDIERIGQNHAEIRCHESNIDEDDSDYNENENNDNDENKIDRILQSIPINVNIVNDHKLQKQLSEVNKDAKGKRQRKTKVEYWTSDGCESIEIEINNRLKESNSQVCFGYKTNTSKNCVEVCYAADHGQGFDRGAGRMQLIDPMQRKTTGDANKGSCSFDIFGTKCKKDSRRTFSLVAELLNNFFMKLTSSKLLGIMDEAGNRISVMIPKAAKNFKFVKESEEDVVSYIEWETDEGDVNSRCLVRGAGDLSTNSNYSYWVIIEEFEYWVVGDSKFLMMLTGRDGYASCRCVHCKRTKVNNTWELVDDTNGEGNAEWTHDDLLECFKAIKPDLDPKKNHAVSYCPNIYSIDPQRIIPGVLHVNMGLVNDTLKRFVDLVQNHCGQISNVEYNLRIKHKDSTKSTNEVTTQLHDLERQKSKITVSHKELNNEIKEKKYRGSELKEKENEKRILYKRKMEINSAITDQKKILQRHKRDANIYDQKFIRPIADERRRKRKSPENIIFEVLNDIASINPAQYHGGSLIGGHCQALCSKADEIFQVIREKLHELLQENTNEMQQHALFTWNHDQLDKVIAHYRNIFKTIDAVMGGLRVIHPSEEEKSLLEKSIDSLNELWLYSDEELNIQTLSVTPKAHTLFSHIYPMFLRVNGFGDKDEEFIEKRHQEGKKLEDITKRMTSGFEAKIKSQRKYRTWISHPKVIHTIEQVNNHSSQNRKGWEGKPCGVEKKQIEKELKKEKRAQHINSLRTSFR